MLNGPTNPLWVCDHCGAFLLTGKEGIVPNSTWGGKVQLGIMNVITNTHKQKSTNTLGWQANDPTIL